MFAYLRDRHVFHYIFRVYDPYPSSANHIWTKLMRHVQEGYKCFYFL